MPMREECHSFAAESKGPGSTSELLILSDGRILVHNLTPAFAAVLALLNPADEQIRPRAISIEGVTRPRTTDK